MTKYIRSYCTCTQIIYGVPKLKKYREMVNDMSKMYLKSNWKKTNPNNKLKFNSLKTLLLFKKQVWKKTKPYIALKRLGCNASPLHHMASGPSARQVWLLS